MSIKDKINYYKDSLNSFDDTMEKYKFLLDQGKKLASFPEEFRQDSFKVSGCQSQVWIVPYMKNNFLLFHTDSDAFIAKGMVTVLSDIYGNNTPQDIAKSDFELVKKLGLDVLLTPGRTNGVYAMLKKIQEYALAFSQ